MEIVAKFDGQDASQHVLPAFEGAQSLEGLARSFTLIAHYAATGEIRKRYPFESGVKLYIQPPRQGSFEAAFSLLTAPDTVFTTTALGALGVGMFGNLLMDLIKLIGKRLTGGADEPSTEQLRTLIRARAGELEALGEAVEPSLKKAHTVINNGAGTINVFYGDNNIVNLNSITKEYITSQIEDDAVIEKLVSVGMLNANTRNGRVYDWELGRTVPIHVPRTANPRALNSLAISLERYSARAMRGDNSDVTIRATTVRAVDGTVKRYLITDAFFGNP